MANFSYSPVRALNLVSPNIFGTPADGSYSTEGTYFEDAAYIGLLPLASALFGFVYWLRMRREQDRPAALSAVPFWAGMALLTFLIALGKNGPLFPLLYRFAPTFSAFQGPVRWLILAVFALSMLAGIGASYAWKKGRWVVFWNRLTAAGGIGMALVALFVAPRLLPPDIPELNVLVRGFAALGLFISGCAILTLIQPDETHERWRPVWQAMVLIFIAFDLFWASRGLNPTVPADFFQPHSVEPGGDMLYMPAETESRLRYEAFFPPNDYRIAVERWPEIRASLLPNLNLLDRVPMFNNFDPMLTQAYVDARREVEATVPDGETVIALSDPPRFEPFGQMAVTLGAAISVMSMLIGVGLWMNVPERLLRLARRSRPAATVSIRD